MSGSFRARRPVSPPPDISKPLITTSQRFPHPRGDHLDADERRAVASKGFGPSRTRSYPTGGLHIASGEWKLLIAVVLLASAVRFFRLGKPNSTVFDEVHFGKFASKYIKTQYFVDVHPPLAKLLITLAAFVFGYDGHFEFKDIGKIYEQVPYVAMRMVPATLGVATIPLAYLTLRALDCRVTTALLASLLITFENGMITQSRHILLDSPLIFFTALSIFLWCGFSNEDRHEPFTTSWWTWLTLSGLSLGAVVSCKWVGLFTIATLGIGTLYQLWNLLGDLRVSPRLFIRHFMARALCLIVVPVVFYMAMFQIHFMILQNSGDGDGFMTSEFQHTLGGRSMADTYADVAIGSTVTIRHVNTQGGYLHSHPHTYPGGSKQQQITLYPHRDDNNNWRFYDASDDGSPPKYDWENEPLKHINASTRIRLRHIATERHLHSHDHRPPVSDVDFQNEVSAYGMAGFVGDANDDWYVEIEHGDSRDSESSKRLRTLRTTFRLRHALTGCYLFSHKVKLPDWGFEQQEVTCNKNAVRPNSLWMIETAEHTKLPADAQKVNYLLPGFLSKFWELQQVMWTTNAGLTERHTFDSRPDSWPLLRRGINFWVKDHRQIYLIGNPMIWYSSTMCIAIYVAVRGLLILRAKRGYRDFDSTKVVKYDSLIGFLFIGWGLHYFPFFLMSRQLFLHHYFPALYFAILLSCVVFDLGTSMLRSRTRLQIAAVLIILVIWNYQHLSPLTYGSPWTRSKCQNAKWLKTWDFSCQDFYESYAQYEPLGVTPDTKVITPILSTVGGEQGGRAPIVIEDKNIQAVGAAAAGAPEKVETMADPGKAEPGRDIFAGEVVKDIKSSNVPPVQPPAEPVREQKEISSVNVGIPLPSSSSSSSTTTRDDTAKDSASSAAVASETATAQSDAKTIESSSATAAAAAKVQAAGPLGEAELEAQKVANELYPDAEK